MNKSKSYIGIDYFRFVAAVLVIAIHTSPLSSFSETGDFILTRIIGRIAVPFFFMTSGFFLVTRYSKNNDKIKTFVKKVGLIYGISILIYIPLNLYNKYFQMDNLLPNIIKDIFFDGTIYHLWYLPASIIGVIIAYFIVKRLGFKKALIITLILYAIGLFGDSYYGFSKQIPLLHGVYSGLFEVSDYTRNGVFLAPIFFVLGGIIADKSIRISFKSSIVGFAVSFLWMLAEGMMLHKLEFQRHDSMYIMLLPCMYFLFNTLTYWRGKRNTLLSTSALVIYIIHPMMIVAIRMFAKLIKMQELLVDNSIVHFLLVSILSLVFAVFFTLLLNKVRSKYENTTIAGKDRAWIEVDLNNLKHNVSVLKKAMPEGCDLMAVVKAEAYGHGCFDISTYINGLGVKAFAVATIDEAIELRRHGIVGEILVLGFTSPRRAKELHKHKLTQTLIDYDYARLLSKQIYKIRAHIKVDTGMHRLGFDSNDTEAILKAFTMKNIEISGIYTHLCAADSLDEEDISFTKKQIRDFYTVIDRIKENGIHIPKTHIQSSYGFLNYPELKCSYVRAGVSLYGVLSSPYDKTKIQLDTHPVLSLKSQIVLLRQIKSGESVGYGRAYVAERDSYIAIIPIGYADGLPRSLSCRNSEVLIKGQRVPIIGRICMDQLAVDVTDMSSVSVGDVVTLIGKDGEEELYAATMANISDSITNELLSRMGRRLKINIKN